ncbi:MAG: hypothetical protein WCW53_03800 [Syntrophales bacterium]|jgi:hypothetical protein
MIVLRINQFLINHIRTDLTRPHSFAYERVGFLYLKQGAHDDGVLLIAAAYETVPDDQYINDHSVGARINSHAIRKAMQRIMDTGESAMHVHMHQHIGLPAFSSTDEEDLKHLIPSFQNVGINVAHGALVLSINGLTAIAWLPKYRMPFSINRISVIGFPTIFYGGNICGRVSV